MTDTCVHTHFRSSSTCLDGNKLFFFFIKIQSSLSGFQSISHLHHITFYLSNLIGKSQSNQSLNLSLSLSLSHTHIRVSTFVLMGGEGGEKTELRRKKGCEMRDTEYFVVVIRR